VTSPMSAEAITLEQRVTTATNTPNLALLGSIRVLTTHPSK
jgi:hypothetical protein